MGEKRKKTINDMTPEWRSMHNSIPALPSTEHQMCKELDITPLESNYEEVEQAKRDLGDINLTGQMVGDVLAAIDILRSCKETNSNGLNQLLDRIHPLLMQANEAMRKAGEAAYHAGIRPLPEIEEN